MVQSLVSGLLLLEDVHFFLDGSEDSIVWRLQWHIIAAVRITHMLGERMSELVEEAEREKALKDVANDTARDKAKDAELAEKKAWSSKKARQLAEKRLAEMEAKLGEIELKLAQAESLYLAHVEEIADLKEALEACKDKWYNEGFADAKNFVEPVVLQARA